MAEKEIAQVLIRDWPGLVTQADRQDLAPGAGQIQVNLQSDRPGEMRVRRGLTLVQFDPRGLVELTDIVSVQESVNNTLTIQISTATESSTVSEVVSAFVLHAFADGVTDSVNTSETLTVRKTMLLPSMIESVSVSEFLKVEKQLFVTVTDSNSLSEQTTATIVFLVQATDSVSTSETLTVQKTMLRAVSDSVAVLEQVARTQFNNTLASFGQNKKLILFSGQFSSTVVSSVGVVGFDTVPVGISWDGTNAPWTGQTQEKLNLQSGQFSSTLKTSLQMTATSPQDVSWDGANTPWCGIAVGFRKLYLSSAQFSGTLKTSLAVVSGGIPYGISWDATNTPWCGDGTSTAKLLLQSGHLLSTIKTSLSVSTVSNFPRGVSWDGVNTPWVSSIERKLFLQSGQFSSTLKTSSSVLNDTSPSGIETNDVVSRLS